MSTSALNCTCGTLQFQRIIVYWCSDATRGTNGSSVHRPQTRRGCSHGNAEDPYRFRHDLISFMLRMWTQLKKIRLFFGGNHFYGKGSPLATRGYEIRNRVRNNLVKVSGSGGVVVVQLRYRLARCLWPRIFPIRFGIVMHIPTLRLQKSHAFMHHSLAFNRIQP